MATGEGTDFARRQFTSLSGAFSFSRFRKNLSLAGKWNEGTRGEAVFVRARNVIVRSTERKKARSRFRGQIPAIPPAPPAVRTGCVTRLPAKAAAVARDEDVVAPIDFASCRGYARNVRRAGSIDDRHHLDLSRSRPAASGGNRDPPVNKLRRADSGVSLAITAGQFVRKSPNGDTGGARSDHDRI